MDRIDSFSQRILLGAKDGLEVDLINKTFVKIGLPDMEGETEFSNIIPKLQTKNYDACVLHPSISLDLAAVVKKIRNHSIAGMVPLVVIISEESLDEVVNMYDAGATLVIPAPITDEKATQMCWFLESLSGFIAKYTFGRERAFR